MEYIPVIYKHNNANDQKEYLKLLEVNEPVTYDKIEQQLLDLLLCRNPSLSVEEVKSRNLVEEYLRKKGETLHTYGNSVYYAWKNTVVRVLPENEFIEVRTNRNKYKITEEEQRLLGTKIIGIAGLSVGRTIATTIALERIAGEVRLADFDEIDLSNLNRIKAPLSEMGINKSVAAAREIVEFDPYIKVKCFFEGLTEENMDSFFRKDGKMNLFIEECDDVKIKILSRQICKSFKIPVVMETNDRCIIDVERFDLEPDQPIFHGKLSEEDVLNGIKANTFSEMFEVLSKIIDVSTISDGMKKSLPELNNTIRRWPQLASEVNYGGGIISKLVRLILLNQIKESGQFIFEPKVYELSK